MSPEWGRLVIKNARSHVGSHYIHGAYGARPGKSDGCSCRPGGVELIKTPSRLNSKKQDKPQNDVAVMAASTLITADAKTTYSVCAGSWRNVSGGRWTHPEAWDLTNYLSELGAQPVQNWKPYFGKFTPRRAYGPGQKGEVYWGESCEGIRHFDCVGFISFVLWQTFGKAYQHSIANWRRSPNNPMQGKVFELAQNTPALADGDILVQGDKHIGFVAKDGEIIQAADTDLGVTNSARFPGGAWTHLLRLPDLNTPAALKEAKDVEEINDWSRRRREIAWP